MEGRAARRPFTHLTGSLTQHFRKSSWFLYFPGRLSCRGRTRTHQRQRRPPWGPFPQPPRVTRGACLTQASCHPLFHPLLTVLGANPTSAFLLLHHLENIRRKAQVTGQRCKPQTILLNSGSPSWTVDLRRLLLLGRGTCKPPSPVSLWCRWRNQEPGQGPLASLGEEQVGYRLATFGCLCRPLAHRQGN